MTGSSWSPGACRRTADDAAPTPFIDTSDAASAAETQQGAQLSTMSTTAKRTGLLGAGIVVLIIGLLSAFGLWISANERESDAVRNLARAPIGCDTTLDFESDGVFYIYIETAGRFDDAVSGDCGAEGEFELVGDSLPPVTLSLTAPNGDDVTLDSRAGVLYDAAGSVGQSVRSFTIDEPGGYRLRVEAPGSTDVTFAAAVGRDPSDGVGAMHLGAVLAGVAGLLIGGLLMLVSRRSSGPEPLPADTAWPGQGAGWPTSPPGMPIAPPAPIGTTAPLGPPTQHPTAPPGVTAPGTSGGSWAPRPAMTPQGGSSGTPNASSWGAAPNNDSTGDRSQSPWAPPSDAAQ